MEYEQDQHGDISDRIYKWQNNNHHLNIRNNNNISLVLTSNVPSNFFVCLSEHTNYLSGPLDHFEQQ